jgi:hypothetical protein
VKLFKLRDYISYYWHFWALNDILSILFWSHSTKSIHLQTQEENLEFHNFNFSLLIFTFRLELDSNSILITITIELCDRSCCKCYFKLIIRIIMIIDYTLHVLNRDWVIRIFNFLNRLVKFGLDNGGRIEKISSKGIFGAENQIIS